MRPPGAVPATVCATLLFLTAACGGSEAPAGTGSVMDTGTTAGPGPGPSFDKEPDDGETSQGLPPCGTNVDCPATHPMCDTELESCVQCFEHDTCGADMLCLDGLCRPVSQCAAGEKVCNGSEVWTCRADGLDYDRSGCDITCFQGRCVTCKPGSTSCKGKDLHLCQVDGSGTVLLNSCADACVDGACAECVSGQARCAGTTTEKCSAEEGWVSDLDCTQQGDGQVCFRGRCVDPCSEDFKFSTNMGCEYWAADLDQTDEGNAFNSPFAIVVANVDANVAATVTLFRDDVQVEQLTVEPQQLHTFAVPPHNIDGTMQGMRSFRVKSTRPMVAYQFNPLENVEVYSNDASMLLPQNSLGTRYRVLGWPERSNELRAYVTIVATRPDTEVTVTVTAPTRPGGPVPALQPGGSYTTTLQPFEVLSIETGTRGADLTGSLVESSKAVAVFSGTECSNVPDTTACTPAGTCAFAPAWQCRTPDDCPVTCCCDHLEEQMIPESAWGREYVAGRTRPRNTEGEVWRVLASVDGTSVSLEPSVATVPTLAAGQFHEFEADGSFLLRSNHPVLLGQFVESENAPRPFVGTCREALFIRTCTNSGRPCNRDQDCRDTGEPGDAGIGDPAFILGVPIEQLRSDYIFLIPDKYAQDFLTVFAREGTEISLDASPIDGQLQDGESWQNVADGWRVLHKRVPDGVHRLAADQPFGVIVHGYDQFVSYGYPAGMNVTELQ